MGSKKAYAAANLLFILCIRVLVGGRSEAFLFMTANKPPNITDLQLLYSDWSYPSENMVIWGGFLSMINFESDQR